LAYYTITMPYLYNITPNSSYVTVLEVSAIKRETLHDATVYQIDLSSPTNDAIVPGFREADRLVGDQQFIDDLAALCPMRL